MNKLAKDIVKGDKFRYITDYDFFGKPIYSMILEASDDAMEYKNNILVPFGGPEGLCYMGSITDKVEIIND